jgi:protein-tyrosine phosphatase
MSSEIIFIKPNPTFNHIIDNLYLGDIEAAQSNYIIDNNITIIINVSNTRYLEFDNITYYHFDIDDNRNEDISKYFSEFNKIIQNNKNQNIFVHCMNSVSRSVALVLSYLLHKMTLCESYIYLKSKRNQYTKPNIGFIKQLIKYENQLYNYNTMIIKDFI